MNQISLDFDQVLLLFLLGLLYLLGNMAVSILHYMLRDDNFTYIDHGESIHRAKSLPSRKPEKDLSLTKPRFTVSLTLWSLTLGSPELRHSFSRQTMKTGIKMYLDSNYVIWSSLNSMLTGAIPPTKTFTNPHQSVSTVTVAVAVTVEITLPKSKIRTVIHTDRLLISLNFVNNRPPLPHSPNASPLPSPTYLTVSFFLEVIIN